MTEAKQPIAGLSWFHIDDPNSAALDELAQRFQLHPLQIEDCRHPPQRPKVEEHSEYLFVVLKHLHAIEGQDIEFDDFDAFIGPSFLVTVTTGDRQFIERVCTRARQENLTRTDKLFYMIVDEIVDAYTVLLDRIADESSEIESEVLENPDPPMLRRIFRLKRGLIEFRRMSGGMREVVNAIIRREHGIIGDDLDIYFRDVYDHLIRTVDLIETYRDLLTGSLDIYLSAVANRTNQVMKVLTVYGTVSIPLVVITGFFGMNLKLPWMESPHGVWYASALMLASTVFVLLYFRAKRWF
jgi:magnesium transporter